MRNLLTGRLNAEALQNWETGCISLHCVLCIVHCEPASNVHIAPCVKWPPCSLHTVHIAQCTLYKMTNVQCVLWHVCTMKGPAGSSDALGKGIKWVPCIPDTSPLCIPDIWIPLTIPSYLLWLCLGDFIQPQNYEIFNSERNIFCKLAKHLKNMNVCQAQNFASPSPGREENEGKDSGHGLLCNAVHAKQSILWKCSFAHQSSGSDGWWCSKHCIRNRGERGGQGFVKSRPCRNLLGPTCFDGKFYRRPPIKFYIISTAMVRHGTRAQWWTQDRQSVAARAKVEPLDDQREPLWRPGVHLSLHFFTGTCTCTWSTSTYNCVQVVTMRHRCRKSLLGPLVFSPRPYNSCGGASFLFLSPFPQYSP